ncbi:MAG: hypothetical protein ACRBHB_16490 [Arenicella sp.]
MQLRRFPILIFSALMLSACQPSQDNQDANHSADNLTEKHDHTKHDHGTLDIESFDGQNQIPALTLDVQADSMSGWNLQIKTEHFSFTPEQVGEDATAGEGHAHLFVDNYKIARLYGNWYHLKKLTPGKHEVRVTLNANDHSTWATQGNEISATITIEQD